MGGEGRFARRVQGEGPDGRHGLAGARRRGEEGREALLRDAGRDQGRRNARELDRGDAGAPRQARRVHDHFARADAAGRTLQARAARGREEAGAGASLNPSRDGGCRRRRSACPQPRHAPPAAKARRQRLLHARPERRLALLRLRRHGGRARKVSAHEGRGVGRRIDRRAGAGLREGRDRAREGRARGSPARFRRRPEPHGVRAPQRIRQHPEPRFQDPVGRHRLARNALRLRPLRPEPV